MPPDDDPAPLPRPAPPAPPSRSPDPLDPAVRVAVAAATPARLFLAGSPLGYPTRSWLSLRADHAAARDAVASVFDLDDPALAGLVAAHHPLELSTSVADDEHLTRPDRGRLLAPESRDRLAAEVAGETPATLSVVLGDGLSATAAITNGPAMVDSLVAGAVARGWTVGRPLVIHHCRVGVLNDLGPLLGSDVVVLLVGERPGLAVADSLSAYLAWRPRPGHTDAERNLVSGIHHRGTPPAEAAVRVLDLAAQLVAARTSGVAVKEILSVPPDGATEQLGRPEGGQSRPDGASEIEDESQRSIDAPELVEAEVAHAVSETDRIDG